MSEAILTPTTKVDLNPRDIIKKLNLDSDGSKKLRRQVMRDLEGLNKDEQLEKLREMFPSDPIWLKN